jgi:hypothetical protein
MIVESLVLLSLVLGVAAFFGIYFSVKFGLLILKLQDDIEESLDELDKSAIVFSKILEKPVFFDSMEVRSCINEIRKTRNIVLNIAQRLTAITSQSFNDNEERDIEGKKENIENIEA